MLLVMRCALTSVSDGAIGCFICMNNWGLGERPSSYNPESKGWVGGEGLWLWNPPRLDAFKSVIPVAVEKVVNGSGGQWRLLRNEIGHLPASAAALFL